MTGKEETEEIRFLNGRFRGVMETDGLAWWEMELPSGEVDFSDSKAEMLGYSPEKFSHYEDFTSLLHPDDRDKAMKAMRDHLEGREDRYETEYRIETESGEYKWFRDLGRVTERDDQDNPRIVTGIVVDLDERKRLEETLHESIKAYRRLLDTINDAVMIYDEEGDLLEVNKSVPELLGYSREELLSLNLSDILPDDEEEQIEERLQGLKGNKSLVFESVYLDESGERVPVEVSVAATDFHGRTAFLAAVRDISQRQKFQRREFLYSLLRQDMKNKFTTLIGYLQLIEDVTQADEEYLGSAIDISDEGQKLVRLAEMVNKSDEETLGEYDIVELIEKACEGCDDFSIDKEISVTKDLENIRSRVRGGVFLERLFPLLVETRVKKSKAGTIRITGIEESDEIRVVLDDDGERIPEKAKRKLTGDVYDGETSGIGGPVYFAVREIINNYEGSLKLRDSDMSGASIELCFKKV